MDLASSVSEAYALVDSRGPMVYAFNLSGGGLVWATRVALNETPSYLTLAGDRILVATVKVEGNESLVSVYSGARGEFRPLYTRGLPYPLYRILAAKPTASGDVVVVGARYRAGRGYQYFTALLSRAGVVWRDWWGGRANEYFNSVSLGPDSSICAAGPPGGLACYTYDGQPLYRLNLSFEPLAVLDLGSGEALVAGVSNSSGVVALVRNGRVEWLKATGLFAPTSLCASNTTLYVGGVLAPKPYRIGLLALNASGSPVFFGYDNRSTGSYVVAACTARGNLVVLGGALSGRPFARALLVLRVPSGSGTTAPPAGGGGAPSNVIVIEEAALAAAAVMLAVTLWAFKPWRWRRR